MIKVYHGENQAISRKAYVAEIEKAKNSGKETVILEGKKMTLTDLTQCLQTSSLFKFPRVTFIENLFSLPAGQEKEKMVDLVSAETSSEIVIWESKELSKTVIEQNRSKAQFFLFKIPDLLFSFLDSLKPGEKKNNLTGLEKVLDNGEPEMVFLMVVRQIRLLILAKDGEKYLTGQSWQKEKLLRQSQLFSGDFLASLYKKLLETDYRQKTSQTLFNLHSSLELLILEI